MYNAVTRGRELLPPRSSTAVLSLHADVQHTLRDPSLASPVPSGGGLAQLGEHYVRNVGVAGSTPVPSTKKYIPKLNTLSSAIRGSVQQVATAPRFTEGVDLS